MGSEILLGVAVLIACGVVQGGVRRKRNPFLDLSFEELPDEFRAEIQRVFPDFRPERARRTQRGEEARVEGDLGGQRVLIEAEFGPTGAMVEFERHVRRHASGHIEPESAPEAVKREFDRALGEALPHFVARRVNTETLGGEEHFEMKGAAGEWKWEIAVSRAGRLLESLRLASVSPPSRSGIAGAAVVVVRLTAA